MVEEKLVLNEVSIEFFSEMIHTGFRKAMDSKWSVLVWNVVRLTPPNIWEEFLTKLQCELIDKGTTGKTIYDFCHGYEIDWKWLDENRPVVGVGIAENFRTQYIIFVSTMNIIPEVEVEELFGWILFCMGREEGEQNVRRKR